MPEIDIGSLPHQELRFVPESIISPYVSLISPGPSDNPLVYKVAYNGDIDILSINGKQEKFAIALTLVNTFG